MKRIGILGGSFDPAHRGHVAIARAAVRELHLDEVLFVPARLSPLKNQVPAPPRHRLALLRLAIGKNPRFKISEFELRSPGPSYTIRTLKHLRKIYPGAALFLLMGSDAFSSFHQWKQWKKIPDLCSVAVARRRGGPGISSRLFKSVPGARILKASIPRVSSTDLRRGKSAGLPAAARRYIRMKNLYASEK